MKKGFFLLTAMASLFANRSYGGVGIDKINSTLDNCPNSSRGGKPSKRVWKVMYKKMQLKKRKNRIVKRSRNINHGV